MVQKEFLLFTKILYGLLSALLNRNGHNVCIQSAGAVIGQIFYRAFIRIVNNAVQGFRYFHIFCSFLSDSSHSCIQQVFRYNHLKPFRMITCNVIIPSLLFNLYYLSHQ